MDEDLKARLLKPRLGEEEVPIAGIGTVRVRGLNRLEVMQVQQVEGNAAVERRIIALGMVDPRLSEAEVAQWQESATALELEAVCMRIAALSGMVEGAGKSGVQGDGDGPDAGVRAVLSPAVGDDEGEAAGGDAGG